MKIKLITFLFVLSTGFTFAQYKRGDFMINGYDMPYRVSYPSNYDAAKQYPLIIFLHGSGECGNDNEKQLSHGGDFLWKYTQAEYPAIVLFPQCPTSSSWTNMICNNMGDGKEDVFDFSSKKEASATEILEALISNWLSSGKIDTKRVYIGGLSLGGIGTYEMLWRMPNTFAAAFVMCGAGDPVKTKLYAKKTAIWIFQGEADPAVPFHYSKAMYEALKKEDCKVKYTTYAGIGHDCWDTTFQNKKLVPWLFSQTK